MDGLRLLADLRLAAACGGRAGPTRPPRSARSAAVSTRFRKTP